MYLSFGSEAFFVFVFFFLGRGLGGNLWQSFLDSLSLMRLRKLKGGFPLSRTDFYIRTVNRIAGYMKGNSKALKLNLAQLLPLPETFF